MCGTDPTPNSGLNITSISKEFGTVGPPPSAISTADYLTAGAYFNFNIKLPLWSRQDPSAAAVPALRY